MLSPQVRLWSAALTIAIVAPAIAAHAQAAPAVVRQDTAGKSLHLRAGGGVDVTVRNGANTANGLIGVDWQPHRSRFSLRMGVDYSRRAFNNDRLLAQFPELCNGICQKSVTTQLAGVSLDGRFDLMTTRLRPYLVSGASQNLAMRDDEANMRCDDDAFQCVRTPGEFHILRQTTPTLGLHAGVGLSLQVGRSQLFTEFRVQTLTNAYYGSGNKPMMLGIRF
jgi:hypothetical protein